MKLKAHPLFEKDVAKLDKREKERLLDALEKIKIPLPDFEACKAILKIHTEKFRRLLSFVPLVRKAG